MLSPVSYVLGSPSRFFLSGRPTQAALRVAAIAVLSTAVIADGNQSAGRPSVAQPAFTVVHASTYHAIAPVRVLDTSTGTGGATPLTSETPRSFQLAGAFGIPDGATALAGTLSISSPSRGGYVALTAVSTSPASVATSTINFTARDPCSAGVTATLGDDGRLWALYEAGVEGQTVQMSLDVQGYYVPDDTGATYHALGPARIFDSRSAVGGAAPLTSGVPEPFQLAGAFGIPVGATSVTGALTIASPSRPGRVALTPAPAQGAFPTTSTLTLEAADPRATGATATLDPNGRFWATYETGNAGDTAQLVFDLSGYFTPDMTGSTFHRLGPLRLVDSRSGVGASSPLSSGVPRSLMIVGLYGIPVGATAITGTLTVANPTHSGDVALTPVRPPETATAVSSLDSTTTDSRATTVTTSLGADGMLWATFDTGRLSDTIDIIFDLAGYFAPDAPSLTPTATYFDTFGPFDSAPRDSNGVVLTQYPSPIGLQYNAVNVSQAAIAYFDRWHSGKDTTAEAGADRTAFFAQVNWLVENQQPDGRWLYAFQWGTQPVPWWSAMAEGQGMSALLRAYSVTGEKTYLAAMESARSTFDRAIADLGVESDVTVAGRQLTVYQEYLPGYEDNVLNGWMFALAGLYEDARFTGDPIALYDLVAADRGLPALRALLPYYDTGTWSLYSLSAFVDSSPGRKAPSSYHALHIRQLRFLYSITGDPVMKTYADKFESYLASANQVSAKADRVPT